VYYLLYADGYEMPSKVAFDPGEPSLGRIWADFVTPPRNTTAIKKFISSVEIIQELARADFFADFSLACDAPSMQTTARQDSTYLPLRHSRIAIGRASWRQCGRFWMKVVGGNGASRCRLGWAQTLTWRRLKLKRTTYILISDEE
jgi:hypothetical protein